MLTSVVTLLLQLTYVCCVAGLSLYGFNALWLTWLRLGNSPPQNGATGTAPSIADCIGATPVYGEGSAPLPAWAGNSGGELPVVTIQLPIYNEQHVVVRLLRACARVRYPQDRLQIQVLDDSDDVTREIIRQEVHHLRQRGIDIEVITRTDRTGFKAGALQHGLATAKGEFIAIFDADFEPSEDFLEHTLPHFFKSDNWHLGFIQSRWDHLNPAYSPLTQSQALALDGHFLVEQPARQESGYFFGFNGSGGIWRRACIIDAAVGGWQTDTLCEDLDLSYRAQLAGWRGLFLADVTSPAEIPPQLLAFKRQQFRWAKGSIQTLRKLAPRIWRADLPVRVKIQAGLHLGAYLVHPILLLLLLISLPLAILPTEPIVPMAWLSFASFGPPLLYAVAQKRRAGKGWWRRWRFLPLLTLLGTGLSLNNSIAVIQGFRQTGGEFLRTPKFSVEKRSDQWQQSGYRLGIRPIVIAEFGLTLYALMTAAVLIQQQNWSTLPFILLYAGGFGLMAGVGLWQSLPPGLSRPGLLRPSAGGNKRSIAADAQSARGWDARRTLPPARRRVRVNRGFQKQRGPARLAQR